jgi:hypothetical protein
MKCFHRARVQAGLPDGYSPQPAAQFCHPPAAVGTHDGRTDGNQIRDHFSIERIEPAAAQPQPLRKKSSKTVSGIESIWVVT